MHDDRPLVEPISVGKVVARFAVAGFVALVLVIAFTAIASRRVGTEQAIEEARRVADISGIGLVAPVLDDGVVAMDRDALDRLDAVVRDDVLRGSLVRVKIWREDGTIVYADEPRLIGEQFPLDDDALEVLATGGQIAEVSDLSGPENRYETERKLLEVYTRVETPSGTPLLFETYFNYGGVTEVGRNLWLQFAPITIAALILLELVQIPIAWSMARRLQASQQERERLLRHALEASDAERRRIASDLHDGVVQELTGVSLTLAAQGRTSIEPQQALDASEAIRSSVKSLRSLLVEIYPPNLAEEGLESATRRPPQRAAGSRDRDAPRCPARRCRDPERDRRARLPRGAGGVAQRGRPCRRGTRPGRAHHRRRHGATRRRRRRSGLHHRPSRRPIRRGPRRTAVAGRPRRPTRRHAHRVLPAGHRYPRRDDGPPRWKDAPVNERDATEPIRVVIVDDHAVVRSGLEQFLAITGDIEVVATAANGNEALERVDEHRPDVVLMDLSMPELDGIEATRRLTETYPDSRVLVLTSFSDQTRIMDALGAGADGYLLKHSDPDDIAKAIRAVHEGGSPLDPKAARTLLESRRTSAAGPQLTDREREVLLLVTDGLANKQIARRLGISERTVKAHLTSVFQRLGVTDRTQAALWAREHLAD